MPKSNKIKPTNKLEEKERKQREKLVNKLGFQKSGEYTLKIGSQSKEIIDGIGTVLKKTPSLRLICTGGSLEGYYFGINLDEDTDLLLRLYDSPNVSKVKLDKGVIKISVN